MGLSKIKDKLFKKVLYHMKNRAKQGHSARRGNRPSPYTKYRKSPYIYTFKTKKVDYKNTATTNKREFLEAAE